jgi:hypothetical protein
MASRVTPFVARARGLAATVGRSRVHTDDLSLQADSDIERARLRGQSEAYAKVAAALSRVLEGAYELPRPGPQWLHDQPVGKHAAGPRVERVRSVGDAALDARRALRDNRGNG